MVNIQAAAKVRHTGRSATFVLMSDLANYLMLVVVRSDVASGVLR